MCCGINTQQVQNRQSNCGCGWSGMSRHFLSPQEEKAKLEEYQEQLTKELAGVQECINRLQTA